MYVRVLSRTISRVSENSDSIERVTRSKQPRANFNKATADLLAAGAATTPETETFKTRSYITRLAIIFIFRTEKNYLCHPLQPVAAQTLQGGKQAFGLSNKSN